LAWDNPLIGIFRTGIIPLAFALSAVNLFLLGRLTGKSYLTISAILAGLSMIICALLLNRAELYFAAAAGIAVTGVIPNILQIQNENRAR
jgi:hypothetical protein